MVQLATLSSFFLLMLGMVLLPVHLLMPKSSSSAAAASSPLFSLSNCFSAGVFLATFFVGLLPDIRTQVGALLWERRIITLFPVTEFVLLLGMFISLLAEQLVLLCRRTSSSASSSHNHSHDVSSELDSGGGGRACVLLLSLGVHSVLEGITLGLQSRVPQLLRLFLGVLLHESLVALAVGVSLARAGLRVRTALPLAAVFAVAIPAGQALGIALGRQPSPSAVAANAFLQALAAGTFVHVTFLEIIPEGLGPPVADRTTVPKLLCIAAGFGALTLLSSLAEDAHQNQEDSVQQLLQSVGST